MRQQTLADNGFERFRKQTRRETFLLEMDQIIPWRDLCRVIKPFYPKRQGAGRPTIGLERMLRIHFLQHWFNLSDPAVEEALYLVPFWNARDLENKLFSFKDFYNDQRCHYALDGDTPSERTGKIRPRVVDLGKL